MNRLLLSLLLSTTFANAVPNPGDSIADQSFSISSSTSGNTLQNLTDTSLSQLEGKVAVIVYFTPW
ncbi:MAG: hypothetical protein ACSHYB_08130 [Roseibacillus sp.]